MKQDTMNLILVNPQQINVSNPEIWQDYFVPTGIKITPDMIIFSTEKTCRILLAPMHNKDII